MKREIDYERVLHICGLSTNRSKKNAPYAKAEVSRQKKEFDDLDKADRKKKKKAETNRIVEAEISEIESEYI